MRGLGNGIQNFYGQLTIAAPPGGGVALSVTGVNGSAAVFVGAASSSNPAVTITSPNTSGQSKGFTVEAGTTSSDFNSVFYGASGASNYLIIYGDGGLTIGAPTGGDPGLGGLNIQSSLAINGNQIYSGIPQRLVTTSQSTVLSDASKHLANFTGALTITIAANASVPYPIGTTLTFVSGVGEVTTIAITSDTLYWAATGGTGTRTLAALGIATALKVGANTWIISGTGLS